MFDFNDQNLADPNNPDQDPDGDPITYSIVGGNKDELFAINTNTGEVSVADTKQLDFETASRHVLQIQAADRSVTNTAELTINVGNFNEFKPDIRDATTNPIAEDSAAGTVVFDINDAVLIQMLMLIAGIKLRNHCWQR